MVEDQNTTNMIKKMFRRHKSKGSVRIMKTKIRTITKRIKKMMKIKGKRNLEKKISTRIRLLMMNSIILEVVEAEEIVVEAEEIVVEEVKEVAIKVHGTTKDPCLSMKCLLDTMMVDNHEEMTMDILLQ